MKKVGIVGGIMVLLLSTAVFAQQPEQNPEDDVFCPEVYAPVCGLVEVECIAAPCDPIPETFSNSCFLQQNERARYLHDGECDDTYITVAQQVHDQIADLSLVDPVLGGTWHVVQIEFMDSNRLFVTYEDGHIQEDMDLAYTVDEEGEVTLYLEETEQPATDDEEDENDEDENGLPTEDAMPDSPANEGGVQDDTDDTTEEEKPWWSCFARRWNNFVTWIGQR